jgi:pimeloyl-ACP methyl ester carboxylesterase
MHAMTLESEETVISLDGLEGVFMAPRGAPTGAGVVIIAGSGPTDANGNNPLAPRRDNHRKLARGLADAGIASVRYDKRGIARSAAGAPPESQVTLDLFARDAATFAEWMKARPGIERVFLCGHSEGALLACLAARLTPIDGLALLAGAGRRLESVLIEQLAKSPMPPELMAKAHAIVAELVAGRRVDNPDPALGALFRASIQPFMISVFARDPAHELATCGAPALIIGGGRDVQITRADFDALVSARPDAESAWFPDMGHSLTDETSTPPDVAQPLTTGLVETITAFITRRGAATR